MNKKALFFGIITLFSWASAFAATSVALTGGYTPEKLIVFRVIVASFIFFMIAFLPKVRITLPSRKDFFHIAFVGLCGVTIYSIGITYSQQYIDPGTAGMIVGSAPIFASIFAMVFLKERLRWYTWLALFTGFLGITLITLGSSGVNFSFSKSMLPAFIAMLAAAVYYTFQKPLLDKYDAISLAAYFTWIGAVPLLLFAPGLIQTMQQATLEANLAALQIAIFSSAVGYVTWALATKYGDVSKISTLLYLESPFAIIIAWVWLKDLPTVLSMIGGFIVLVSVITVNWIELRNNVKQELANLENISSHM